MHTKINRILIPFIVFFLLSFVNQIIYVGQTIANRSFLPIVSYNLTGWIGPYGGTIVTVAVDPSNPLVIYAGSYGSGVYKSIDGGHNWKSVSFGLTNLYTYSLAIDPTQPSTLYAGTYRSQVYKSDDGGNSWFWSGTGIQDQAIVYNIAIDPIVPSTLYAATRGISNGGAAPWKGVVYKSIDAGQTWIPVLSDVGGTDYQDWVYSLTVNPNSHNEVYAAIHEHGPYHSIDFGSSWYPINNGISDYSGRAIVICPQLEYSSILYHGVWHLDSVYKSVNHGDQWASSNGGFQNAKVYSIAIDPYIPNFVYMATFSNGILRTVNGGSTWQSAGLQADQLYSVVINPNLTNNLFAGTGGDGLYRSLDSSASWQPSNTGINNAMVTSSIRSPIDSLTIYASVYGAGIYQSKNRGQTWDEINTGLGDKLVHELAMDPVNPSLLYALTDTGGLYQNDLTAGNGWINVGGGLPLTTNRIPAFPADHPFATLDMQEDFAAPQETTSASQITSVNLLRMIYAPSNPQLAYMGTGGSGVYKSTNGGLSWQPTGLVSESILSLAVDRTDSNLVYAATNISGRIKISLNGGNTWIDDALPVTFYSLAASPTETGILYAGTNSGVYRYQTGNWSGLGLSDQSVTAIAVDPVQPGVIYAGTTSGAYYSINNGLSWNFVDKNLLGITIQSISFDRTIPNVVYFSTKTHGIFLASILF